MNPVGVWYRDCAFSSVAVTSQIIQRAKHRLRVSVEGRTRCEKIAIFITQRGESGGGTCLWVEVRADVTHEVRRHELIQFVVVKVGEAASMVV